MIPSKVRRLAAVCAALSLAAAGAALAQACGSSTAVPLPGTPDGSAVGQEASTDAPFAGDVIEAGGESSVTDGPRGDAGTSDAGDASDAGATDAPVGDAPNDARVMVDAQALCNSLCDAGTCTNGSCGISCTTPNTCTGAIVCPPGIPCTVACGNNDCTGGVDCTQATTCDITCSGANSCTGSIHCGGQSCSVDCSGSNSCPNGACCEAGTCMLGGMTNTCP